MSVNYEIKSHLARLLATEDLVVEHRDVKTATFDTEYRVLTLPMWGNASNTVYDLLVGHEVGHALFTPVDWYKHGHKDYLNVVEDVRIDKLMKRKYPGFIKIYGKGYGELCERNFFKTHGRDISTFNLADRINLYFKVVEFSSIKFTSEEQEIVDKIGRVETFDDVINSSTILLDYCTKEFRKNLSTTQDSHKFSVRDLFDRFSFECDDSYDVDHVYGEGGTTIQGTSSPDNDYSGQKLKEKPKEKPEEFIPNVETISEYNESLYKLLVDSTRGVNTYVEIPKLNLNTVIIKNSEIHDTCEKYWESDKYSSFSEVDEEFFKFKKSSRREVNYLVKEFECRKAADSYSRSKISNTGIIDCSKLHSYKYNEDLFRKVTTLADGKNHGLIFILDWSGSMNKVILDTVKQLIKLVLFCKQVSIPFEVYAFTVDYNLDENNRAIIKEPLYKPRAGIFQVSDKFSLMNILTSKTKNNIFQDQIKNIYRIAKRNDVSHRNHYNIPANLSLSGTPLNESLVALHEIIPMFQKENNLQKVQCIILTDGESGSLIYHKEFQRTAKSDLELGYSRIGSNTYLRDRKLGNTYNISDLSYYNYHLFTKILLTNLKDKFPDTNFIGIRIIESSHISRFIRLHTTQSNSEEYNKMYSSWRKTKSFTIKDSGYHSYFAISDSNISNDVEFEVDSNATNVQIKNAFIKSLKSKMMNKKILNEFVELIV